MRSLIITLLIGKGFILLYLKQSLEESIDAAPIS